MAGANMPQFVNESSNEKYGSRSAGVGTARPSRPPPLHPSQVARLQRKGNGSPAYASSHGTPSRMRPKTRAYMRQFGNWESEDNVPSRGSVESEELPKRIAPKSSSQSQLSEEDSGEYRHSAASAHGNHKGTRGGVVNKSSHGGHSRRRVGGGSARPSRPPSVGSDCSIDRSPPRKLARMWSQKSDYHLSMQHSSRGSVKSEELAKRVVCKLCIQSRISKEGSSHDNYEGSGRRTVVNEQSHGGYGGRSVGGESAEPSSSPSVGSDCSIEWFNDDLLTRKSYMDVHLSSLFDIHDDDGLMVNRRGTNPVSENSPPSNISPQSNKDAKAKGGCLPFHFPFAGPKKKRT